MDASSLLFNRLLRAHHNACMAALSRLGVGNMGSPPLLVTLAHWSGGSDQDPTQKELADWLHSSPPTIAASLKCLERKGYVVRRTDERDSRRNRISITREGREAVESGARAFQQVDDRMYQGFSRSEREQVYRFHQRMLENLYEIGGDQEAEPCPPPPIPPERKCDPC